MTKVLHGFFYWLHSESLLLRSWKQLDMHVMWYLCWKPPKTLVSNIGLALYFTCAQKYFLYKKWNSIHGLHLYHLYLYMKIHVILYKFTYNYQFIMRLIKAQFILAVYHYRIQSWRLERWLGVFKNLLLLHRMHVQFPALNGGSQPSLTSVPRNL